MRFNLEDRVDKIASKGGKLGELLHFVVKNKSIAILSGIVVVVVGIFAFFVLFGKKLILGKK